jgi:hypothetical protein
MSGLNVQLIHRVKGRPALVRSLRALLLRVHRYGRHRARTADERRWAAVVLDHLTTTVQVADPGTLTDPRPIRPIDPPPCPHCDTALTLEPIAPGVWLCPCCASTCACLPSDPHA